MAAEPEVLDELRRLRARVPHLTGSLAASVDGLVMAQDTRGVEPESIAALTAAALGVALRLTEATGQGAFKELVLRGEDGYVATYAAGPTAVLTVLAEPRANVGRLHLEARRSGARIAHLADGAQGGDRRARTDEPATADPRPADERPAAAGPAKSRSTATSSTVSSPAKERADKTRGGPARTAVSRAGPALPVRSPRANRAASGQTAPEGGANAES